MHHHHHHASIVLPLDLRVVFECTFKLIVKAALAAPSRTFEIMSCTVALTSDFILKSLFCIEANFDTRGGLFHALKMAKRLRKKAKSINQKYTHTDNDN